MNIDLSNLDKGSIIILYNELLHAEASHLRWLHGFNKTMLVQDGSLDSFLHKKGHELCTFGKWISNQSTLVEAINTFDEIIREHKTMHDCSYKIAHQKSASKTILATDYEAFTSHQYKLLRLISSLRESLKSAVLLFDPLTETFNRQMMDSIVQNELERGRRQRYPCALAMLDIDHFKNVNDKYGHQAGDIALVSCANSIKHSLRPYDNVFRFGGEEFLVLLPNTELATAENIINRIRIIISELLIPVEGDTNIQIMISAGVSEIDTSQEISASISKVDKALYEAKQSGRNRVVCRK